MTLVELTAEERRLLRQVRRTYGSLEEKVQQLDASGVLTAYRNAYKGYVALIGDTPEGLEALKRALFLQWIAFLEPVAFTGIPDLDNAPQHRVLEGVQRHIQQGRRDEELIWMLRWYDSITEWYFDEFTDLPVLHEFLEDKYGDIPLGRYFTENSLKDRGQMGAYWLEMLIGQMERIDDHNGKAKLRTDPCSGEPIESGRSTPSA